MKKMTKCHKLNFGTQIDIIVIKKRINYEQKRCNSGD
jgi:hypothetical protein